MLYSPALLDVYIALRGDHFDHVHGGHADPRLHGRCDTANQVGLGLHYVIGG